MNPLIELARLPAFSKIKPEHVKPALEKAIAECRQVVEDIVALDVPYTWDNLVMPLDDKDDILDRMWSPVSHLNSVCNSDELREVYEACLPLLSEYSTYIGQNEALYQAYHVFSQSDEYQQLNTERKKVIDDTLRDLKLSGIGLSAEKKQRFGEISARLSELSSKYSNNVLDATTGWNKLITVQSELAGLPESSIAAAKAMAEDKDMEGWLFTLDFPSFFPVMIYSENRALREEVYRANCTRASGEGPNAGKWDNTQVMDELLALKQESANLLDFDNYTEESMATKMAESSEQVLTFLHQLASKSKKQAKADFDEVVDFAKREYQATDIQAWDLTYYSEQLKQQKYAISDEALRPYFPEDKVVSGLFETVKRLFKINVVERKGVEVWHENVRFYDIFDESEELRGSFYFDLYAREKKRGGAWMDDCVTRRIHSDGQLQKPVAYLNCNFNKPVGDTPALFTHEEVTTLFHEFGHGIHHMLTKVEVSSVSGINGVAWDAVELPSQFLENWCFEPEALAYLSGHHQTGEPLPQDLLDKMLAARNFQSAMQMMRQLEFSLFDLRIHAEVIGEEHQSIGEILDEVRDEVSVFKPPAFNRFQHSFSHIFAGGYAAGYYSYKWAEVLSSDAFSRFEEEGIFNPQTGADFLHHILEKGGSEEPMELFKAFRGREPSIEPLLRHCGIA
ncbi:MAG: oligopeptidase A [Algicola sp.]|nr:oligopeptidase A [Algicola sp.]